MDGPAASPATPHPQETRDLAYQLWAFVAGRDLRRVAELLASGDYGESGPITVPDRTLRDWRDRYQWAERAAQDVERIAPDLRHQAFAELVFAGLDGAKYIRQVIAGTTPPDKVRAQLAVAAVDRIGFSPVGKADPFAQLPNPSKPKPVEAGEIAGASPDVLARMEGEYRSSRT